MMHPTATGEIDIEGGMIVAPRIGSFVWRDCKAVSWALIFRSPIANFLEMSWHGFHYSVIGQYASIPMASGRSDRHLLNDHAATPTIRDAARYADER